MRNEFPSKVCKFSTTCATNPRAWWAALRHLRRHRSTRARTLIHSRSSMAVRPTSWSRRMRKSTSACILTGCRTNWSRPLASTSSKTLSSANLAIKWFAQAVVKSRIVSSLCHSSHWLPKDLTQFRNLLRVSLVVKQSMTTTAQAATKRLTLRSELLSWRPRTF